MQTVTTIGLDIAKSVFQVHGVDREGNVIICRQLKRLSYLLRDLTNECHVTTRDLLLTCSNVGLGPFDSMTGGFALAEFLFAAVARKMGTPARKRLAQFEQFQIQEEKPRGGIT
jgi:hypothetical protein